MGKTAILAVKIIGDANSAVTSMDELGASTMTMQDRMDRASVGAGIALGALAAAATAAGNAASNAQQAVGAVDSIFGAYSARVQEYAANAADAVGLAEDEYNQMASILGAQLKNMGLDLEAAVGQTDALITMGADLAATFGGTTADAVAALSSLLKGERDPIERYGVSIKQATIDAKLAEMGLAGLTGEAATNAQMQATLALLTQQTADATGQFAREADTAAGQQQRANAAWQDALAVLGEQLLPIMSQSAMMLADVARWVGENSGLVSTLAIVIGALAAGILVMNIAMRAYSVVQGIATAATWASNAAWLANPITWIVLGVVAAIAAVVAIVILVITYWDEIAAAAGVAWSAIIGWIQDAYNWLAGGIVAAVQTVQQFFFDLGRNIGQALRGVVNWIKDAYNWLLKLVGSAIPGWVKDMLGMKSFSAQMTVQQEQPMMASARMAFAADETAVGFGYRAAPEAAPMARTAAPSFSDVGSALAPARSVVVRNEYKITVNGAIDRQGTADTIVDVLTERARSNGDLAAAGASWR